MSEHLSNIMEVEDSEESVETITASSGKDRLGSIMDMDYDAPEPKSNEPEDDGVQDELPLGGRTETSDTPKEKKEEKEDKEEKEEEKEKKEEEKKIENDKRKVKYKVDGQEVEEELTDEEISSAVSGRKAIQKRFTELDQQKKTFEREKQDSDENIGYVKSEMKGIRDGFDRDIEEFKQNGFVKGNPIKSVYNLLDKMGLDASQFEKAVFFHHLPEVSNFLEMNESERQSFLLGRENEWLRKGQDAVKEQSREASERSAKLEQENSVKRQAGVSEELFSELREELSAKGLENLTTEQVLEWHQVKPTFNRAEAISAKVPGTNVMNIAKLLLEFPSTTDEWVLNELGYKQLQEKKLVDDLRGKIPVKKSTKSSSDVDDIEDELFKQFRRR